MNRNGILSVVLTGMVLFILFSCGKEDISENAARLRIKLTDAASPVLKEMYLDLSLIHI